MKSRNRNLLTVALASALMSPLAFGQADPAAQQAQSTDHQHLPQAQEIPRPALPPVVTPRAPVASDPRLPVAGEQSLEDPMTSSPPPPQAQADTRAATQSAASQRSAWDALDSDGDGQVSAAEANADEAFAEQFDSLDADRDGYVSASEYRAPALAGQGPGGAGMETPPPRPSQSQGASSAAAHSAVAQRDLWSRLDTDGDGRISSVEGSLDPDFSESFADADSDRDGFVTADEYRAQARPSRRYYGDGDIDQEPPLDEGGIDPSDDEVDPMHDDEAVPALDDRDGGGG